MSFDESSALRRLVDKDAIIDLVHRYSFCVDHRLYDEVVSLFAEECVVDYGPDYGPPIRGRVALRKMFGHPAGGYRSTSHHNANVLVDFDDDDHATVRASVYAWHQRKNMTTPMLWGYYHDTVERSPGGWLIATRELRVLGLDDWDAAMHPAVDPP